MWRYGEYAGRNNPDRDHSLEIGTSVSRSLSVPEKIEPRDSDMSLFQTELKISQKRLSAHDWYFHQKNQTELTL